MKALGDAIDADVTAFTAIVYRATEPDKTDLEGAAQMSRAEPGRFNTANLAAVYASAAPETALAEFRKNHDPSAPYTMVSIDARVERLVDLCNAAVQRRLGVTEQDLKGEDQTHTRGIALALSGIGCEAIRWPSAAGDGDSLVFFPDAFRPDSRLERVETE